MADDKSQRRAMRKLSCITDSQREKTRKSVEVAAKSAFQKAESATWSSRTLAPRRASNDFSINSHSSFLSRERAMRRGTKRGWFEPGEEVSDDGSPHDHNTTVTDSRVTNFTGISPLPKRNLSILRKTKKPGNQDKLHLTSEIAKEAWMCGVCAKSFSSFEAAEKHEDNHILEVISDLGWVRNQINNGYGSIPIGMTDASNHSLPATPEDRKVPATPNVMVSTSMPRPDVLTISTPARSNRVTFQPHNTPTLQRTRALSNDSFDQNSLDCFQTEKFGLSTSIANFNLPSDVAGMSPILESPSLDDEHDLLMPNGIKKHVVLADEALVDVCLKAERMIITPSEMQAEIELEWLAKDKAYYDLLAMRSYARQRGGSYSQFKSEGKNIVSKVQNKFVDAYQLMKEGKSKRGNAVMDHYNRKMKGDEETTHVIEQSPKTLYVNVIVKNSLKVVRYELERLAKIRWEENKKLNDAANPSAQQFERFRAAAQENLVKLAGLALEADFTPRRIAVQLSNDLYRLLTPRLKRRGISIESEIEYRVGPFFVLAVNIKRVDWKRFIKYNYRDVRDRKRRWKEEHENSDNEGGEKKKESVIFNFVRLCYSLTRLTQMEVMAQSLAWCYYFHWIFYTPICIVLYHTLLGKVFRKYFLSSVTDEIFYFVEQKGMDMEVQVRDSTNQTAFMLSALREIRADGRELKKKEGAKGGSESVILGPLLGPAIKSDKGPAPSLPSGFEIPENLENIGLELDLAVGFKRLRWALMCTKSTFVEEAVFKTEAKYENIQVGEWNKHTDVIGLPTLPDNVKEDDVMGAEREMSYLMPKSAFVKANMCYETAYIEAYNDYCFCMKKKALTPEVPYGSTFIAWTKFTVINTGSESCKLICSVEAEFPNGPPMVSRQIVNGMKAGVGEFFVKFGETVTKYADEYP